MNNSFLKVKHYFFPYPPKIELANIRIVEEVLSSPLITVVPHLENIAVIGRFENPRRFLLHDQAWKTRFFDFDDLFENGFDPFGRKSGGGLVGRKGFTPIEMVPDCSAAGLEFRIILSGFIAHSVSSRNDWNFLRGLLNRGKIT